MVSAIGIKIKSNIPDLKSQLGVFERFELPFITAKTLTETAQRAQTLTKNQINRDFVVRKTSFPNSIKIRPATKNSLVSEVYTRAPFAEIQEFGGVSEPTKSRNLIIPLYADLRGLKKRAALKMALKGGGGKNKAFRIFSNARDGRFLVRRKRKERYPLEFLFEIAETAFIPPRLKMFEIAESVVRNFMPSIFKRNAEEVLGRKLK